MNVPFYIPYNISNLVDPIVLSLNTTGSKIYSAINIDFDDKGSITTYLHNFNQIDYVYQNVGTHTVTISAHSQGDRIDIMVFTIEIYQDFAPYDNNTLSDYISATTNDYNLPYDQNDFIQSNDWIVADNINAAFSAIYINFQYLENLCHKPNLRGGEQLIDWLSILPEGWVTFEYFLLGDDNNDFISTSQDQLLDVLANSTAYLSASSNFSNIIDIALLDNKNGNIIHLIDGTFITVLSSGQTAAIMLSTNNIQFNKVFTTPNSIDVDSLGNVYVADTGNNEVYKFRVVNGEIIQQNVISGLGAISDNYRLNNPNQVRIDSNNRVLVSDRDNYAIKIYDNLITWIATINVTSAYGKILGMCIDPIDDSIFAVTDAKNLLKFNSAGQFQYSVLLPNLTSSIRHCFMDFNGNYVYVACTGVVFKFTRDGLFLKTLSSPVVDNQSANQLTTGRYDDHDQMFICSRSRVFRVDDTPPIIDIKPDTSSFYYKLNEISIDINEGIEDWVYNKSLNRLIHNHKVFAENLYNVFVRNVTTDNKLVSFTTNVRSLNDQLKFIIDDNLYIGANEHTLVNTVNRVFVQLFNFQLQALKGISPKIMTSFTVVPSL
jgi:hypothetical protein